MGNKKGTEDINRRALLWALDRLCLWGELDGEESADPHLRGEAAASAKVTIHQIAWDIRNKTLANGGELN